MLSQIPIQTHPRQLYLSLPLGEHRNGNFGAQGMFSVYDGDSCIVYLQVDAPGKFTRVGGSTMGGGAFIGLGNLLTSARTFDELLLLAEKGDHRNVVLSLSFPL